MKKTMNLLTVCLSLMFAVIGCNKSTLAPGGAYAPTNPVGGVTVAADPAFYQVESAFALAYSTYDMVVNFERNNREMLWKLSPVIKHTLDATKDDAWQAAQAYGAARTAYLATPTPAGLSTLKTVLSKMQSLASAATAAAVTIQTPK